LNGWGKEGPFLAKEQRVLELMMRCDEECLMKMMNAMLGVELRMRWYLAWA